MNNFGTEHRTTELNEFFVRSSEIIYLKGTLKDVDDPASLINHSIIRFKLKKEKDFVRSIAYLLSLIRKHGEVFYTMAFKYQEH